DGIAPMATTCGVGACTGNVGELVCSGGALHDTCDPFARATPDDTCNGVDEDCDGLADDDYQPVATQCGSAPCVQSGSTACVGGEVRDSCTPLATTMSLSDSIRAIPGQTVAVPVLLTDVTGLGVESADVEIAFDPNVVFVTGVSAGSLTAAC